MMIQQMVTRAESSRKGRVMSSNTYGPSSSSVSKYYVDEAVRGYKKKNELIRDHILDSIYFL
jgi:hypothetical protein